MATAPAAAEALGFDPDALHAKYIAERDRRLNLSRDRGYIEVAPDDAILDDPYAEARIERAAVDEEVEVLVIGAGFAGMLAATRLKAAGIGDFRMLDRAGDFGGTWYWNRYPGAACDVEAYIYMPLLEEVGTVPSEKYARGPEIFAHAQAIGRTYDLYDRSLFQTIVTDVRWDEEARRWRVETDRGDRIAARFAILATGPISRPKLPAIPGIETFEGHSFHTSRWDYDYTGGSPTGAMTGLADKRVGIIGTGATAVQCVPYLAADAKHLYVFQRTPSAVDVRANRPTPEDWAARLQPGWQKRRMENFDSIIAGLPQDEDLVGDNWTDIWRNLVVLAKPEDDSRDPAAAAAEAVQLADYRKMEEIRARIDATVEDKATADALKPWYNLFCKRPCFNDEYLPAFNRPNVTLVDTKGEGVERITPTGVVAGGREYEVDCLIWSTGYETLGTAYRAGGFPITGVDRLTLADKWGEGAKSLHGIVTRGFPNFFVIANFEGGSGTVNVPLVLSRQAEHIASIIAALRGDGVERAEVSQAAEDAWGDQCRAKSIDRRQYLLECTPGYYNNEGKLDRSLFGGLYGGGPFEYFDILERWRGDGVARDLELEKAA